MNVSLANKHRVCIFFGAKQKTLNVESDIQYFQTFSPSKKSQYSLFNQRKQ